MIIAVDISVAAAPGRSVYVGARDDGPADDRAHATQHGGTSRSGCRPQDVLITPMLVGVTSIDFSRAIATIPIGEQATMNAKDRLAAFALDQRKPTNAGKKRRDACPSTSIDVVDIEIDSDSRGTRQRARASGRYRTRHLAIDDIDRGGRSAVRHRALFDTSRISVRDGVLVLDAASQTVGSLLSCKSASISKTTSKAAMPTTSASRSPQRSSTPSAASGAPKDQHR